MSGNKYYILLLIILALIVGGFLFAHNVGRNTRNNNKLLNSNHKSSSTVRSSKNENVVNKNRHQNKNIEAIIETNFGDIKLSLYQSEAPKTVKNFVSLARSGFYDGTKFHRVVKGFIIQGGDPLSRDDSLKDKWGTGGPGYTFANEIHKNNNNNEGTIAMANAGPNTNGSQFFINTKDNNFLDTDYTVFGEVVQGMDVVRKIENVPVDDHNRPLKDVIVKTIKILSF